MNRLIALLLSLLFATPAFALNYSGGGGGNAVAAGQGIQVVSSAGTSTVSAPSASIVPQYLKNWRKAIADVRNGTGNASLFIGGDSTVAGTGASSLAATMAPRLKALLNSYYVTAVEGVVWTNTTVTDSRQVFGTGWSAFGVGGPGGVCGALAAAGAAGDFTFAPGYSFDTITVYYLKQVGYGTFETNIGGASLGTTDTNASPGVGKVVFSSSAGVNTVHIHNPLVGNVIILGIMCTTAATKAVQVSVVGIPGCRMDTFGVAASGFNSGASLTTLAPNLALIDCTINDINAGTALATWNTETVQFITTMTAAGCDVIIVTGVPGAYGGTPPTDIAGYEAQALTTARANNCGVVDFVARWVNGTVSSALFSDGVHPNDLGYTDCASALFTAITRN